MIEILSMMLADIPQVVEIDKLSFPLPWSPESYNHELTRNTHSHFFVAVAGQRHRWNGWLGMQAERRVIGYAGYWYIVDEAHLSTIAVHPRWRGRGFGEQLLRRVLIHALALGAVEATLEVRVSNEAAQSLYRKYGFEEVGRRKHYYRDNGEDALLMSARPLRIANNETWGQ